MNYLGSNKTELISTVNDAHQYVAKQYPGIYDNSVIHISTSVGVHKTMISGSTLMLLSDADYTLDQLGFYPKG